jgi:hypothetical protein
MSLERPLLHHRRIVPQLLNSDANTATKYLRLSQGVRIYQDTIVYTAARTKCIGLMDPNVPSVARRFLEKIMFKSTSENILNATVNLPPS